MDRVTGFFCETCGSPLTLGTKQKRFCSNECQRQWLATYRPAQERKAEILRGLMKSGRIPKPPRPSGPFRYPPDMRAAIHLVKTGSRIADLTPEQQELYRAYNRANQRRVKARRRERLNNDGK